MANIPVGVQLYTLRDLTAKDFSGTLEKVAAIGYAGVELAGTGGLSATDLKKLLERLKLRACGAHVGLGELEGSFDKTADYYSEAGVKTIIMPWLSADQRTGADFWKTLGKKLNDIGAKLRARGMTLAYHNHDFEFAKTDGQYGLDILFASAEPQNLKMELDVFWAQYAGENPATYAAKYKGRLPLLHMKDMTSDGQKHFAPVGTGLVNIAEIVKIAPSLDVQWFVVEQDDCYGASPLDAIRTSLENLRKLGVV